MKAAVLHALGQPPRFEDFADPEAIEGEVLVRVTAASLKNVDRMMASGSHYDRLPHLPCVCGLAESRAIGMVCAGLAGPTPPGREIPDSRGDRGCGPTCGPDCQAPGR